MRASVRLYVCVCVLFCFCIFTQVLYDGVTFSKLPSARTRYSCWFDAFQSIISQRIIVFDYHYYVWFCDLDIRLDLSSMFGQKSGILAGPKWIVTANIFSIFSIHSMNCSHALIRLWKLGLFLFEIFGRISGIVIELVSKLFIKKTHIAIRPYTQWPISVVFCGFSERRHSPRTLLSILFESVYTYTHAYTRARCCLIQNITLD